jgi:hypothetical protein
MQSNAINTAKQKQQQQQGQSSNQVAASSDGNQINSNGNLAGVAAVQPDISLPSSSKASNSKDSNDQPSKRGSASRRQSKGKSARARGGKGKALSQTDKEDSGSGSALPKARPSKSSSTEKLANQAKKRSSTKAESVPGVNMPEPARKMIKLEPQKPDGKDSKDTPPEPQKNTTMESRDANKPDGDESKQKEITVVMDDNEAKKKLVMDDSQDVDADPAPLSLVSRQSIEKHLNSLEKPSGMSTEDVKKACLPLVQAFIDDPFGWVFRDPVDPDALGLPDYFEVVKKPMHLELVKAKLEGNEYADMDSFQKDASLVFENSILYNGESSEVGQLALNMLSNFADKYEALVKGMLNSS